ncbi:hypothetical protein PENSPDRAFT_672020 [Peniophora sp. CONT]|nr:hypothetical protein PENSPDRAFT_672020 [Peniophora sp. CONT]
MWEELGRRGKTTSMNIAAFDIAASRVYNEVVGTVLGGSTRNEGARRRSLPHSTSPPVQRRAASDRPIARYDRDVDVSADVYTRASRGSRTLSSNSDRVITIIAADVDEANGEAWLESGAVGFGVLHPPSIYIARKHAPKSHHLLIASHPGYFSFSAFQPTEARTSSIMREARSASWK